MCDKKKPGCDGKGGCGCGGKASQYKERKGVIMMATKKQEIVFLKTALRALMDAAPEKTGGNIPLKIKGIPDDVVHYLAEREMGLFGKRAAEKC